MFLSSHQTNLFTRTWGHQIKSQQASFIPQLVSNQGRWAGKDWNAAQTLTLANNSNQALHTYPGTSLADCMHKQEEIWFGKRPGVPA